MNTVYASELIIRQTDVNQFKLEASWLDTKLCGCLTLHCDPNKVTLDDLFKFANKIREAGENGVKSFEKKEE